VLKPRNQEFPSSLNAGVEVGSTGAGGQVTLVAEQVRLAAGGQIRSTTYGSGKGGGITIRAQQVDLLGTSASGQLASGLFGNTAQSTGNGGSIRVEQANRVTIAQGATINVSNFETQFPNVPPGTGTAGTVDITAKTLQLREAGSIATATLDGGGGGIQLSAGQVQLQTGARIDSSTAGRGQAGQIELVANTTDLSQSTITTSTSNQGNAGQIRFTANQALLSQSQIASQSTAGGNAGTVTFWVSNLGLDQASVVSTEATAGGKAGDVAVRSQHVSLRNQSQITSRSRGTGNGGTIDVIADTLSLNNGSTLNAQTSSGNGRNIDLKLSTVVQLQNQSVLSAEAGGVGNGGNITLSAPFVIGLGNSDIVANAVQGRGGSIQITTQGIFGLKFRPDLTPDNDISASSQFGVNGSVQITTLAIDPTAGLLQLPVDIVDPTQQIAAGCAEIGENEFMITGRGGIEANPTHGVGGDRLWQDTRRLAQHSPVTPGPAAQAPTAPQVVPPLVEATAWYRNPVTGKVELVAPQALPPRPGHCAQATKLFP
jgi:large exoprotein involved in heme utilization and adhesion